MTQKTQFQNKFKLLLKLHGIIIMLGLTKNLEQVELNLEFDKITRKPVPDLDISFIGFWVLDTDNNYLVAENFSFFQTEGNKLGFSMVLQGFSRAFEDLMKSDIDNIKTKKNQVLYLDKQELFSVIMAIDFSKKPEKINEYETIFSAITKQLSHVFAKTWNKTLSNENKGLIDLDDFKPFIKFLAHVKNNILPEIILCSENLNPELQNQMIEWILKNFKLKSNK